MFAVVALIKIDVDACPRQCDQLDGRGSGDKKNDGGNVLNPRSEDPHKTVSVCGRDVEARVGVLLFFLCVLHVVRTVSLTVVQAMR